MVWFAWNNEVWSFIDKILALCLALQKKKGPPQSQWWRTLISSLHICWFFLFTQCLNFNSKGLNPLCYSEHFLGLKQWSSEFERTGEEQQASIRVWRRGLFTELPSLHLASPLPRLGRQLQFVYLLGLATQIPAISCHCLSSHHNEKKKTDRHTRTQKLAHPSLLLTLYITLPLALFFPSEHPASVFESDHCDAQCGREPATGFHCALIVPEPSKCQWCLQGMPAVCVRLCSARASARLMSLHVHMCTYRSLLLSSPTGDTMLWSCLSSSMRCDASSLCYWAKTLCVCICRFMG